jgi:hypothetical protein
VKIDRKVYWDTTCWLAWLNDERSWPPGVVIGIQELVYEVEVGTTLLFTSAVTRGEIYMGRLTLDQKNMYAKLMRRRNVTEISADPRIMDRASQIREYHDARGQKIQTPDATHLATAVLYRADEFHTMDGLRPGKTKRKLLKLDGDVGGYRLMVVNPYSRAKAPPKKLVIEGPLIEKIEELTLKGDSNDSRQHQANHELKATPAHSATVQGSDGGRAKGETPTTRKGEGKTNA